MIFFWGASLLLPKWSSDLKYGSCPPARDLGTHVCDSTPHFVRPFDSVKLILFSENGVSFSLKELAAKLEVLVQMFILK